MPEIIGEEKVVRKDCTVEVNCIQAFGRNFTTSYIDWNLPKHQKAILKILKRFPEGIHIHDFMREWERLPMEDKI